MQEGWHYLLEEDELKYNGIVYNEMKGAYSDPYRLLFNVMDKGLYPNASYKFEAGGNPDFIPDVVLETFLDFHKKYYRPENSLIFFYGDMDIEKCFEKLDKEYLSSFEKIGSCAEIKAQPALSEPVFDVGEYSVNEEDDLDDNYMAVSYAFSPCMSAFDVSAMKVLNYILMGTPASPLYKALVEAEVGEDLSGHFSKEIKHPAFGISMRNGALSSSEFKEFLDKTLAGLAKDGINKDFVTACLNFLEFQAKEEDYGPNMPKGLIYVLRALGDWLYGKPPWEPLMGMLHLEEIRKKCDDGGYFEGLIEKYLLGNNHAVFALITPVLDLDETLEEALAEKLAVIKESLSDTEKEAIVRNSAELKAFQAMPDTPEELALIPRLAVSDIKKEIEIVPLTVKEKNGTKLLHSPLETNDIIYSTMLFDMSALPLDLLPITNILQYLLSKTATKNYDTTGITKEIKGNLGGLGFSTDIITPVGGVGVDSDSPASNDKFTPKAIVSAKFLSKNTDKMFGIVTEILQNSLFNDKTQVKNYLLEMKASMEDGFLTGGSTVAMARSLAYFSPAAAYQDQISGPGFYFYLKELCDNFETRFEDLRQKLIQTAEIIYNQNHACYTIVCNENLYGLYSSSLSGFHSGLCSRKLPKAERPALITPKGEGFVTASKVQYNAMSANFFADSFEYSGALKVLGNVLDNYLFEEIRAKGGAYGYGSGFTQKGVMYFYSYRDPELEATYEVFKNTSSYISGLSLSDKEMEKYIIGTIRAFDRPSTNSHKGLAAASNFLQGWTDEMRQKQRDEILSANMQTLKGFTGLLDKAFTQGNYCAVGSGAALEASLKGVSSAVSGGIIKNIKRL
jgi:hypothetical protein